MLPLEVFWQAPDITQYQRIHLITSSNGECWAEPGSNQPFFFPELKGGINESQLCDSRLKENTNFLLFSPGEN